MTSITQMCWQASSQPTGTGDINEALSTLWYHDHRVGFTAQNTYKGLVGFHLLFNEFDTGDETTGFHLPRFPEFDIPMVIADHNFDPETGQITFDMMALDGLLGDKFLVNGAIQPFFEVEPRRYRFRWLNVGPSRFIQLYLTRLDKGLDSATKPFWLIGNDGNLLPKPLRVTNIEIGVANRFDVIVDFSDMAGQTVYLENRLLQTNGKGATGTILPPGKGDLLLKFRVKAQRSRPDNSMDPASIPQFYALPDATQAWACTRTFKFDGLMECGRSMASSRIARLGASRLRRTLRSTGFSPICREIGNIRSTFILKSTRSFRAIA
jgi:FtsP/CotA-like multicopper oxidase with cupredoxin domain